ncbi:MAG: hypothetical protein IKI64_10800 [Clostridia bacterium]|nr:hypothetical protein [Clostridia bacterium]
MEDFKKKLRIRIGLLLMLNGLMLFAGILFRMLVPANENALNGNFVSGVFVGIQAVCISLIIITAGKLRSEAELNKAYIVENDERKKAVRLSAARTSQIIILSVLALAFLIASCFNKTVALTLLCVQLFVDAVSIISLLCHSKLM